MAYLKNKHLANIKKWNLDLSKYKDGVYYRDIYVPKNIQEFRGFKETFGFEIKEVRWRLYFYKCTSLTSISNLPESIGWSLSFEGCTSLTSVSNLPKKIGWILDLDDCTSLTSVSNLPEHIGGDLYFNECTSLTSILKMPSVVKGSIYTYGCPLFEDMEEKEIREKYGIRKE